MKNTGLCPKCNSSDIVIIKNDGHPDPSNGNNIQTKTTILSGVIYIQRYICCNCGFTEEWVHEKDINILLQSKKVKRVEN